MDTKQETKNITFYVLWPGNTEEHCDREINQVGVEHYRKKYTDKEKNFFHWETFFYKREGFRLLERAINEDRVDVLLKTRIFNSNGKEFSIEQLFDRINKSTNVK
jgi:hypothetical protein